MSGKDISIDHRSQNRLVAGKTAGLLLAVIGAVLSYAQMTGSINMPVILLLIGGAFAVIEIIYATKRSISPIYLADAFAELILIAWWAIDVCFA